MASLKGFLPPAGSALWRKDRARLFSESEGSSSLPAIKHVVIREVWQKTYPSPHALYKIDVMTKSNHWSVFRRYREFNELHKKLVSLYGIPKDMLPPKKFTSKMALSHLEQRKEALEHYLQRLVNSSTYVSSSPEIVEFLEVQRHDVMAVTKALAKDLSKHGDAMLSRGESYIFTPTQLYCISRQLQLPEPTHPLDDGDVADLGNLYDFVYRLKALCISSLVSKSSSCQELASHLEFDISLFKSLTCLTIDGCPLILINDLFKVQTQLTKLTARHCLTTIKELLVDCAAQKRLAPKVKEAVESWRGVITTRLTQNRVVVQPWHQLTHLNLTHNKLAVLDTSLKLLPVLRNLDMSHNEFVHLDFQQVCCPSLHYLNLSHNDIHFITGAPKEIAHLKSLILSHNHLETVGGLDCLTGLIELDISYNQFRVVHEISKLCVISHMKHLSVAGNPFARVKPYRIVVLSYFKGRNFVLDKRPISQKERMKLKSYPTKVRASSTPDYVADDINNGESSDTVAPRSYSFNLFGPPDSDDDSGIEGASSLKSNSVIIDPDEGDDSELLFSWSYYDTATKITSDNSTCNSHVSSKASQTGLAVASSIDEEGCGTHAEFLAIRNSEVKCDTTVANNVTSNESNSNFSSKASETNCRDRGLAVPSANDCKEFGKHAEVLPIRNSELKSETAVQDIVSASSEEDGQEDSAESDFTLPSINHNELIESRPNRDCFVPNSLCGPAKTEGGHVPQDNGLECSQCDLTNNKSTPISSSRLS